MLVAMASALPDATAPAFPEAQPVHAAHAVSMDRWRRLRRAHRRPVLGERASCCHSEFVVFLSFADGAAPWSGCRRGIPLGLGTVSPVCNHRPSFQQSAWRRPAANLAALSILLPGLSRGAFAPAGIRSSCPQPGKFTPGASCLPDRGLYFWRRPRLTPRSGLATGAESGCNDLLQTSRARSRLRRRSNVVSHLSANAAGSVSPCSSLDTDIDGIQIKTYSAHGFRA